MNIENLKVKHKAFGEGVVCAMNGNYITVKFEQTQKVFVYPDIFEKFLTLADGTVTEDIMADLQRAKNHKQSIIDKKNEENLRAMTKGIVVPGRENLNGDFDEEERKNSEKEEI